MKALHDPHALISTARERWLWPVVVGLGCLFFTIYRGSFLLFDPDTLSHIAVGRWIIDHRAMPFHDPFSYTFHGKLWVPFEWLSDVILALAYQYLGWAGVCAIAALSICIAVMLLTQSLAYWLEAPRPAIGAACAYALTQQHLLARPHVLALPFMVFWIARLVFARDTNRTPSFFLLPVMTLWANLHGSFVVGLGFCVLFGLEALYETEDGSRWEVTRKWAVFTLCAVASALLSPNGVRSFLFPVHMMQMSNELAQIGEWQSPDFHKFQMLEVWIGLAIVGGFTLGIRLPLTRVIMVLLLLHEALVYTRHTELVGFIAPLLVAAPLAIQLQTYSDGSTTIRQLAGADTVSDAVRRGIVALVALMIAFGVATGIFNWEEVRPNEKYSPAAALSAARAKGITGPVFNDYNFGAYLIYEGIPTFIDGRAQPYTDEFMKDNFAAVNGDSHELIKLLDEYQVEWTLLRPNTAAPNILDNLSSWQRVYGDQYAVVHKRIR